MRSLNPRHVYQALLEGTRTPQTEAERGLYVILHGEEELNNAVPLRPWAPGTKLDPGLVYTYNVFKNPEIRFVLEAFLIAADNNADISEALAMPAEEINIYRELFFDTSVFKTDLELIVYLGKIPEDTEQKKLYKIAFHQGLGALRWHFCRDKGQIDADTVLQSIMTDSYFRSLEHRGQAVTSKVAKEASRLARTAMDCARVILSEDRGSADAEDLRIQFEKARKNRTIDELQQSTSTEILH